MIEVKSLSKFFGPRKVLDNINIHVNEGSVYGLLGANGAGKTTLIKHLAGIYHQDSGIITVDGKPVYESPEIKSNIVYLPDELFFFSQYSTDEMAQFYSGLYPEWNWERYYRLKQVFPLDPKTRVVKLSKGMQKQAAFWLGICAMPRVMVLDEPMDGLDSVMRKNVWNLALLDVAERNMTLLVSSHNLRELEGICDHIGILHNGKMLLERELDRIKSDIHKLQVAFSGEVPGEFMKGEQVLHQSRNGGVILLIVKGDKEKLIRKIQEACPAILDILPLTLEEIFIYELEGVGYEIQNVLI